MRDTALHRFSVRLLPRPHVEVESGRNADRPKLRAALAHCKQTGATLLIAKLDRLARSVAFISRLMGKRALEAAVLVVQF